MKGFSLLVRTDKRSCRLLGQMHILDMPLVAAAIAAFRETNDARYLSSSPPKFDKITSPAIIMEFGTLPMFYKICIGSHNNFVMWLAYRERTCRR
jgi:hypothetical protein